jgi:hypothetical protein
MGVRRVGKLHVHLGRRPIRCWRSKHGHEVDFVVAERGRAPIAVECRWSAGDFDPSGIKSFRAIYPNGPTFVVASDVDRPHTRASGEIPVTVVALRDLIEQLAGRRLKRA